MPIIDAFFRPADILFPLKVGRRTLHRRPRCEGKREASVPI